jgi:hypothetical protein
MTRQRFEVFTPKHGDVVLTTRFRFVARVVTRFVRTLDYDYPIPFVPVKPTPAGRTLARRKVRYFPAGCHESMWEPLGGPCELCCVAPSTTYFRGVPVCGDCGEALDPFDPRSAWEIFA